MPVVDGIGINQSRAQSTRKNASQQQSQTRKYFYISENTRKQFGDAI